MKKLQNRSNDLFFFRPTGKTISTKELKKEHDQFFHGDLTEEFADYCAHKAIHAFWVNYKITGKKIRKEVFCKKFKEIVNELLNNM
jgi:hypothetical protein